ncbi:MAG: hypothetical protein JXR14_04650 [Paracoccaceae bacterium]
MTEVTPIVHHRSHDELTAAIPHILDAAKDNGRLDMIVIRPEKEQRLPVESARLTYADGTVGDHWAKGCWLSTEDGKPHPDVQICIMSSRCIAAIAGEPENWPLAGDNLFIDMDLSPSNMPPGTKIAIGSVEMVITEEPHNGCQKFIDRFGRDACVFVNTGRGKELRLRGIYGKVIKDGTVSVGDTVRKID